LRGSKIVEDTEHRATAYFAAAELLVYFMNGKLPTPDYSRSDASDDFRKRPGSILTRKSSVDEIGKCNRLNHAVVV